MIALHALLFRWRLQGRVANISIYSHVVVIRIAGVPRFSCFFVVFLQLYWHQIVVIKKQTGLIIAWIVVLTGLEVFLERFELWPAVSSLQRW